MMTRRDALKTVVLASGALKLSASVAYSQEAPKAMPGDAAGNYPFKLPPLGYAYNALEPSIDEQTMHLHHDKHHAAYVENLNKALAGAGEKFQSMTVEQLLTNLDGLPENIRTAVRNNGGGHYNHTLFWQMMKKSDAAAPSGDLAKAIDTTFGGYPQFQQHFGEAAAKVFGSGWAWLVLDGKTLAITSTPNQDSPVEKGNQVPLLGLDVWEHSYYLKYQNRRAEYIKAFWNVVNWDFVSQRYQAAA